MSLRAVKRNLLTLSTLWQTYSCLTRTSTHVSLVLDRLRTATVTHLEIALDVAQQRNITDSRNNQQEHADQPDQDGGDHGQQQEQGNDRIVPIGREVVRLEIVRVGKRVEGESVDALTRSVSSDETFPVYRRRARVSDT